MPATLMDSPALEVHLGMLDDTPVGAVTFTHHGDTTRVWAMGTIVEHQRKGVGRRLLTSAMSEAREHGTRRFYLGATPAGFRLYENLGYETRFTTPVWVSGETHQG